MTGTPNPEAEWFGYRRVAPEEKTARVKSVFSSVAENYDIMNDLMSGGLHRLWKDHFVAKLRPRQGEAILDVAGGTGDIALRCARVMTSSSVTPAQAGVPFGLKRNGMPASAGMTTGKKTKPPSSPNITICDINEDMLRVGKKRAVDEGWLDGLTWITGSAEALPFPDASFDAVTISFGLRNVTRIDQALSEFARVLRPGGRFYCMEFSPGVTPALRKLYDLYSFSVLPWLGEKVANDREAYEYLAESIRQFPTQKGLAARMVKAGFEMVKFENMLGGIAVIHSGWRL